MPSIQELQICSPPLLFSFSSLLGGFLRGCVLDLINTVHEHNLLPACLGVINIMMSCTQEVLNANWLLSGIHYPTFAGNNRKTHGISAHV